MDQPNYNSVIMKKIILYLLVAMMPFFLIGQDADNDSSSSWEFDVAPNFWLASLKGNIGYLDQSLPVEAEFKDLLDQLSFGLMLHAEARKDRFALMTDLVFLELTETGSVSPANIFAEAEITQVIWEFGGAYSLLKFEDDLILDAIGGIRVFSLDPSVRVGGLITTNEALDFVDPYLGLRFKTTSGRWINSARLDIAGFGIGSEISWKLNLLVGYKFSDLLSLYLGYQGYDVDYEGDNNVTYDMYTGGIITGLNFHF